MANQKKRVVFEEVIVDQNIDKYCLILEPPPTNISRLRQNHTRCSNERMKYSKVYLNSLYGTYVFHSRYMLSLILASVLHARKEYLHE